MLKNLLAAGFLALALQSTGALATEKTFSQKQHSCTEALLFANASVIRQGAYGADLYAGQIKADCVAGRPITLSPNMGAAYVSRLCDFSKSIFVDKDGNIACVISALPN